MAGIGLELRELTKNESFSGFLRANLYAAILSSSAWVISIAALVLIYFYLYALLGEVQFSIQFLVAVTYLASASLVTSGLFQQSLVHYIADRIYEKKYERICSTIVSVSLVVVLLSLMTGIPGLLWLLPGQSWLLKSLMLSAFVTLNLIWLFTNSLAGLKQYQFIVLTFFVCYLLIFLLAIQLYHYELTGLIFAYYAGQALMLAAFYFYAFKTYPTNQLFTWDFFSHFPEKWVLMATGCLFQLGIWIDKYLFWFSQETGQTLLGNLSASAIYDMPMFLAFLIMIPGIAMYFYEIEANFSRYYHQYYDAIREGATLEEINDRQREEIAVARIGLINMFKIQSFSTLAGLIFAPDILHALGLAPIYFFLLRIDLIAASMLVVLIALINLLYYLNQSVFVLWVTLLFFISNLLFSLISLHLAPMFYGYGFLLSLIITNGLAIVLLNRAFVQQTFYAFMTH